MDFKQVLSELTQWLKRDGRVSFLAIKRQFDIDDETLRDLVDSLVFAQPVTETKGGLIWSGESDDLPDIPNEKSDRHVIPTSAERRQITVMFCDLADSTSLAQSLDPEDLREVIRRYQQRAAEVIHSYGGHIAQYLGDGLLVYFGWPVAHEDDARRAVLAARKTVDSIQNDVNPGLSSSLQVKLTLRIGVHTGIVVIGQMGGDGRYESLATGETVNISARLEGVAESNEIIISEQTAKLVGDGYFNLVDNGLRELRGIREPIGTYKVVAVNESLPDASQTAGKKRATMIGRERELKILQECWENARMGQGGSVMVSGIAGIGKSTLVNALKTLVRNENFPCLTIRCSPYHTNSALYPIARLIEWALGFDQKTPVEEKISTMYAHIGELGIPAREHAPLLLRTIAVTDPMYDEVYGTSTPHKVKQLQLAAISTWLFAHAKRQPLMVVWDDLHWADPSTTELLGLVLENLPDKSMLSLLTFRPEFTPTWKSSGDVPQIVLHRLKTEDVTSIIHQLASQTTLPEEVVEHIITKTDGVPIFVEELTKMILESDIVAKVNGHYKLMGPIDEVSIPNTIRDSLLARLDQLSSPKMVAQVASIIGREFDFDQLKAIHQGSDNQIRNALDSLLEAELLFTIQRFPQTIYVFKHALVQDAAYSTLLKSTRQKLHGRLADFLEEQRPEIALNEPEVIAHHLNESGSYIKAIGYLLEASELATRNSSLKEAIAHAQKGLRIAELVENALDRDRLRLKLYLALGMPMLADKGPANEATGEVNRKARALATRLGDNMGLCSALFGLSAHHVVRAEHQSALNAADELRKCIEGESHPYYAGVAAMRGMPLYCQARFNEANIEFNVAVNHADIDNKQFSIIESPLTGKALAIWSRSFGALVRWQIGDLQGAVQWANRGIEMGNELNNPYSKAISLAYGAVLFQFLGDIQRTAELSAATIALSEDQAFPYYVGWGKVLSGWAKGVHKHYQEGIKLVTQGMTILSQTGNRRSVPYYLALESEIHARNGNYDDSLTSIDNGLRQVEEIDETWWLAELYRLKGEYLIANTPNGQPDKEAVINCFEKALATSRQQGAIMQELRALCSLARLGNSTNNENRSNWSSRIREILTTVRGGNASPDLQQAQRLLQSIQ